MKVLVTGATGFIGGHVVHRLLADGHSVRCLVRSRTKSAAQKLANDGCELVEGDFVRPAILVSAVAGMDAVIHLVGIISETRTETFQKVHVESTRVLLASAKQAGVRRWLQMSALGTRPDAVARYHQSKWAAEELVRSSGLDWTVFRPSLVLGRGSGLERTFHTLAKWSPIVPVFGGGANIVQPIQVEAVAGSFVQALLEPGLVGKIVPLAGPRQVSMRDLIESITGGCRTLVSVPFSLGRVQALAMEVLFAGLFNLRPPLTRDQLVMLEEDNVVSEGVESIVNPDGRP